MATFNVAVRWEMYGILQIEAKTIEEAKEKALSSNGGLPEGDYIDQSMTVDEEGTEIHNA